MALPDPVRSTRTLLTGLGAVSAGVLVSVLIAGSSTPDGGTADPTGATGAGGRAAVPSASPPGAAGLPSAPDRTRLRNISSGLCLDTRDEPQDGSGARLAQCSTAWTQQWTYEEDGLLRSVADPGLCLDSHKDARRGRARRLRRLRGPDRRRRALRPHGAGRAGAALGRADGARPVHP